MGSKLVCRMKKVKKNDVRGYQIHNLRESESKTNPDIDKSLEHLNRDFVNDKPINFMKKWKETYESQNVSARALRKDAVFYNEFIIGSDKQFFDKLNQSEKDRFFKVATDFFKERYGEQNVLYSIAHYDETRGAGAHAHIAIVPMKDGKLQSKNVFNRNELRYLQDELPKVLQREGFEIERGQVGSKAKHIETATYKMLKSQEAERVAKQDLEYTKQHVDLLNEEIESKTAALDKIEEIESVEYQEKRTWYGKKTDQIVVDQEDFTQLKQLAENHANLRAKLDHANQKNRVLVQKNEELVTERDLYANQSHKLGLELHNYQTDVERIVKLETKRERDELMAEAKEKSDAEVARVRQELATVEANVEKVNRHVEQVYGVLDEKNKEIEKRNQQIKKLTDELRLLKESFEKYKEQVKKQIEKAVNESSKFVRNAMMKANNQWIKENVDNHTSLLHSNEKIKIMLQAKEIESELVEKEQKNKEMSKGDELER